MGSANNPPKRLDDLHKSITMAQIAKAAGVSQGAISSLLNDRDYGIRVSDKTRERVFKVCREMGYIPNDLRAVVRMYPELGDFCLLLGDTGAGDLRAPVVTRMASAIMGAVPDPSHPLSLGLYEAGADYNNGAVLPQAVRAGICSKFLIHGEPNPTIFQVLGRRNLPVISLGYDVAQPGVVSFVPDYAEVPRLALRHLAGLGHKSFAIVSGPFGTTDARLIELHHAVSVACQELGLKPEATNIIHGNLTEAAGEAALVELLGHKARPTAVFCLSDAAARGVLAGALARNVSVPGALSVMGCGNDAGTANGDPLLSTVHLPIEEMAVQGVREIDQLVHGAPAATARKVVLAPSLVTGRSTAARKGA
jgi:LacI family transcriptional regulator